MAGEEVLEAEIHFEMAVFAPEAVVEVLAAAKDLQRLRLDRRFSVSRVENGEIPGQPTSYDQSL